MKASFATVCALLAVSLMVNAALLLRKPEPAPPPAARPIPIAATERSTAPEPIEPAAPRALPPAAVPVPAPRPASAEAPLPAARSFVQDPQVAAVIDAQEKFGAFWKDLDRVFKAKDRLDDAKYFTTVVTATADFLELSEPARTQFSESARAGVMQLAAARREHDEARKLLPPKDKANPATYAAYQQQKDAIDLRYAETLKASVNGVKAQVDPSKPRHAEFAAQAERWIRNLVPKPQ